MTATTSAALKLAQSSPEIDCSNQGPSRALPTSARLTWWADLLGRHKEEAGYLYLLLAIAVTYLCRRVGGGGH